MIIIDFYFFNIAKNNLFQDQINSNYHFPYLYIYCFAHSFKNNLSHFCDDNLCQYIYIDHYSKCFFIQSYYFYQSYNCFHYSNIFVFFIRLISRNCLCFFFVFEFQNQDDFFNIIHFLTLTSCSISFIFYFPLNLLAHQSPQIPSLYYLFFFYYLI